MSYKAEPPPYVVNSTTAVSYSCMVSIAGGGYTGNSGSFSQLRLELILPSTNTIGVFVDSVSGLAAVCNPADEVCGKHGVTVADTLRVFGGRIVAQPIKEPKPARCSHCDKESIPIWRRGGKIVQRTEPAGRPYWACHYCGRRTNTQLRTINNVNRITE
jgi:hypothetical protein